MIKDFHPSYISWLSLGCSSFPLVQGLGLIHMSGSQSLPRKSLKMVWMKYDQPMQSSFETKVDTGFNSEPSYHNVQ